MKGISMIAWALVLALILAVAYGLLPAELGPGCVGYAIPAIIDDDSIRYELDASCSCDTDYVSYNIGSNEQGFTRIEGTELISWDVSRHVFGTGGVDLWMTGMALDTAQGILILGPRTDNCQWISCTPGEWIPEIGEYCQSHGKWLRCVNVPWASGSTCSFTGYAEVGGEIAIPEPPPGQEPPPVEPEPPSQQTVFDMLMGIWTGIISWFMNLLFPGAIVSISDTIYTGDTVEHTFYLVNTDPAAIPDSDWSDGTVSWAYKAYSVTDSLGTIFETDYTEMTAPLEPGVAAEYTVSYIPQSQGKHMLVATMFVIEKTYDDVTFSWSPGTSRVIDKAAAEFTVIPPMGEPAPPGDVVSFLNDIINGIIAFFRELFGLG